MNLLYPRQQRPFAISNHWHTFLRTFYPQKTTKNSVLHLKPNRTILYPTFQKTPYMVFFSFFLLVIQTNLMFAHLRRR